jgi:hypothetical protein
MPFSKKCMQRITRKIVIYLPCTRQIHLLIRTVKQNPLTDDGVPGLDLGSAWLSGGFIAGQTGGFGFPSVGLPLFSAGGAAVQWEPAREAAAGAGTKR